MGYADSIVTVKRIQNLLEDIIENDKKGKYYTTFLSDDPVKLVYHLREAKAFLSKMDHAHYNNNYLHLTPVTNYMFKMERDRVIAKIKIPKYRKQQDDSQPVFLPVPTQIYEPAEDAMAVIGYIIEHKNIDQITFPRLDSTQIPLVINWASKNNYEVKIEENGVTVKKSEKQSK